MGDESVSESLFDIVDEYAKDIRDGKAVPKRSLSRSSKLLLFCESFFEQFFRGEFDLRIQAFDQEEKRKAVRLRLQDDRPSPEARRLIALFERLCDEYPDFVGAGYGGSPSAWKRFHRQHVPRLLERAHSWATTKGSSTLSDRISASRRGYDGALAGADW